MLPVLSTGENLGRPRFPLANGKYRRLARALASLLCFSGLAVWIFSFQIWYEYDATRPRQPEVLSGRVYEQNTHGHLVFLTSEEKSRITKLRLLALGLVAIGFLVGGLFVESFVWRKTPAPWEKRQW
jgi:hypothetical protein